MKESTDEWMTNSIKLNERFGEADIRKEIERIYIESDNYLQRFNAFLSSNETEKSGSDLLDCISRIRRLLKQIDKMLKKQQGNQGDHEIRMQFKVNLKHAASEKKTDKPTSIKVQLFLQINDASVYLGFLGELDELIENVKAYYHYIETIQAETQAEKIQKDELFPVMTTTF